MDRDGNPLSVNGRGRAGNSAIRGNPDCFGSTIPLSAELRTAMAGRQPVYGSVHGSWYPRKSAVDPHLYPHTYPLKKKKSKRQSYGPWKRLYGTEMDAWHSQNGKTELKGSLRECRGGCLRLGGTLRIEKKWWINTLCHTVEGEICYPASQSMAKQREGMPWRGGTAGIFSLMISRIYESRSLFGG